MTKLKRGAEDVVSCPPFPVLKSKIAFSIKGPNLMMPKSTEKTVVHVAMYRFIIIPYPVPSPLLFGGYPVVCAAMADGANVSHNHDDGSLWDGEC